MNSLEALLKTVKKLRSPNGCPWDKEQDHMSLRRYLIEETYETIDAIESGDMKSLMEELGDVLLQVALHAQIASEGNKKEKFDFYDVANRINKKMISRHPHVFGNLNLKTADEVLARWDDFKKKEKPDKKDPFEGIPNSLPALLKGLKISKKASKEGFEWGEENDLWKTLKSEFKELEEARKEKNKEHFEEELGDLIYMLVNIARWYKLDPEETLNKAIKKFTNRFKKVILLSNNKEIKKLSSNELEKLWEKVKLEEKNGRQKIKKKKNKSKKS